MRTLEVLSRKELIEELDRRELMDSVKHGLIKVDLADTLVALAALVGVIQRWPGQEVALVVYENARDTIDGLLAKPMGTESYFLKRLEEVPHLMEVE